ncbi:MAG: DUF1499 domain-containing protein [Gemmatimonadota bacterium]
MRRPHARGSLDVELGPDAACAAVRDVARATPRWRIREDDPAGRRLRAEARTRLLHFTDDVWIEVESRGAGSRVHVDSASRVGFTDFSTNARRVRDYLARLAEAIPEITAGRSAR